MDAVVTLPRLSYPFKAAVSPHAQKVDELNFQWARTLG
jgi:hypothetical protein